MVRASPSARYLLTFKYLSPKNSGKLCELAAVDAQIRNGGRDWRPEGVKARKIGDPTANTAMFEMESVPKLMEQRRALEDEIGRVGNFLLKVEHGQLLIDYYLTDSRVEWADVAEEHGISARTAYERSGLALEYLDSFGISDDGMPRWAEKQ